MTRQPASGNSGTVERAGRRERHSGLPLPEISPRGTEVLTILNQIFDSLSTSSSKRRTERRH